MKEGLIYKIINTAREIWSEQVKQKAVKTARLKADVVIDEMENKVVEAETKYENYIRTSFDCETPNFNFQTAAEYRLDKLIAEEELKSYKETYDELFGIENKIKK